MCIPPKSNNFLFIYFFSNINLSKLAFEFYNNVIGLCLGAKNIKLLANEIVQIGAFNFLKICLSELGLAFCMQTTCNYCCTSKDMQGVCSYSILVEFFQVYVGNAGCRIRLCANAHGCWCVGERFPTNFSRI